MEIKEPTGLAEKQPKKSFDELAYMVKDHFDIAIRHRRAAKFGEFSYETVLQNCYDQYYGAIPCDIKEAFGNMPYVNLTQLKVSALNAWMRDLLFGSGGTPFVIEPTPVPEMTKEIEDETLGRVKEILYDSPAEELAGLKTPQDLINLAHRERKAVRETVYAKAMQAAKLMEKEMWDQCIDGGYDEALLKFIQDFCIYPYAVIEGPTPEIKTQYVWSGEKIKPKNEIVYAFNHVSPFDFFWSPDSTNSQDGSFVIVRKRYTRKQLMQMAQMKSYIKKNVLDAIDDFSRGLTPYNWLSQNPEQEESIWDKDSSLEVLKYYGAVRGSILKEYGMHGLDDDEFYECIIHTLGTYTLKVIINPNPNATTRPIHVTSYEKTGMGIMGIGISQKIRDTEKSFQACLRGMIKNIEYSSGPIGEVDFSRIQQWTKQGEVGMVEPYMINPVDPDDFGNSRPAYTFHNFPNNTNGLQAVCQWFMTLADQITQIPASIHGQPVGTGANRTFRGMSMLYGNALKGVQSGITNIDNDIVSPLATSLYLYNLKYNDNKDIKGDCKVLARGASGLMEKELKKNDMIEAAQIVASLAQTGQVDQKTLKVAVDRVLDALDLLDRGGDDVLAELQADMQPPAPEMDPAAMMAQQGQPPAEGGGEQPPAQPPVMAQPQV